MEKQKTVYVLRNEELGFIDDCPVFTTRAQAHAEAVGKCRFHSVEEADISKFEPCHPKRANSRCEACAIYFKNLE